MTAPPPPSGCCVLRRGNPSPLGDGNLPFPTWIRKGQEERSVVWSPVWLCSEFRRGAGGISGVCLSSGSEV